MGARPIARPYAIVLKSDPRDTAALYNMGNLYFKLGVNDGARCRSGPFSTSTPRTSSPPRRSATTTPEEQYRSLIATVKPAAEARPQLADLQYLLGMAHEKLGDTATASGYYRRALKYAPDLVEAQEGLGGSGRTSERRGSGAADPITVSARQEPFAHVDALVPRVARGSGRRTCCSACDAAQTRAASRYHTARRGDPGGNPAGVRDAGPGRGEKPLFDKPMAAAWGPGDRIYVADSKNNRIVVFDRSGRYLLQFGGFGIAKPPAGAKVTWKPGQLNYPTGVATDTNGDVYVADFNNDSDLGVRLTGAHSSRRFPDPVSPDGAGAARAAGTHGYRCDRRRRGLVARCTPPTPIRSWCSTPKASC